MARLQKTKRLLAKRRLLQFHLEQQNKKAPLWKKK